jgi:superfamily I DNA/RNA helicase
MPNLLVEAGPGCGKTHTITDAYIYQKVPSPETYAKRYGATDEQIAIYDWVKRTYPTNCKTAIYMAYNNQIVDDMKKKIHPDCDVKTHHGWGYTVIRKKHGYIPINEKRGEFLVQKITNNTLSDLPNKFDWISTLRYVEKLKLELLPATEENLYLLQMKYSDLAPFRIHKEMVPQATRLIQEMKTIDYKQGIQYIDQVWLSLFLLDKPIYQYGFVDECQDLSPVLLELSQRLCENLVFVGDRNQAINAWNGADPFAIERIKTTCEEVLPLKLSFRLTPSHAKNANMLRPTANIRTLPEKSDGETAAVAREDTLDLLREKVYESPLIVCRYNAPLVKLALKMVKEGISCRSLGNSVMDGLITTVENRNASTKSELITKLDKYEELCLRTGNDLTKEITRDKFDAIRYVLQYCDTPADFKPTIKSLMAPKKNVPHISLATVHKAKGLENDNVLILNGPLPSTKAKEPSQIEQEKNVQFVGETRSKHNMYYITN